MYGYQQHMWHACPFAGSGNICKSSRLLLGALGYAARLLVRKRGNAGHPAASRDHRGGLLHPEYFPIQFTHVYCPLCRFDETRQERHWLFLKKDGAYLALWCSGALTPYNDTLFDCEFRVYERKAAYVCIAGKREDFQDLDDFSIYAKGIDPGFDPAERRLWAAGDLLLEYEAGHDHTQYIE